jgi:hypothetical protein
MAAFGRMHRPLEGQFSRLQIQCFKVLYFDGLPSLPLTLTPSVWGGGGGLAAQGWGFGLQGGDLQRCGCLSQPQLRFPGGLLLRPPTLGFEVISLSFPLRFPPVFA